MPNAAAQLAVLLLLFATTCCVPAPATAQDSARLPEVHITAVKSPLSNSCTAVKGRMTTECREGCVYARLLQANKAPHNGCLHRSACVCAVWLAGCLTRQSQLHARG
jgi:hypothetical protein